MYMSINEYATNDNTKRENEDILDDANDYFLNEIICKNLKSWTIGNLRGRRNETAVHDEQDKIYNYSTDVEGQEFLKIWTTSLIGLMQVSNLNMLIRDVVNHIGLHVILSLFVAICVYKLLECIFLVFNIHIAKSDINKFWYR